MENLATAEGWMHSLHCMCSGVHFCCANCDRFGLIKPHGKCLAGQEAVEVARHMAEEQGNVSIYSFGVGSGVDRCLMFTCCPLWCCLFADRTVTSPGFCRTELDKIVAASGASDVDCRYMALAVHPESLW
jgi:hypothetical protein